MEEIKACMNDMIKKVVKRDYREKNRAKQNEQHRQWIKNNPLKAKAIRKKYMSKPKAVEKRKARDYRRYWKDPEKKRKKAAKWREKNPNYHSERYWKDPELSRKKDRERRKAYILKYA